MHDDEENEGGPKDMGEFMNMFQEAANIRTAQLAGRQRAWHAAPQWLRNTLRVTDPKDNEEDEVVAARRLGPHDRISKCQEWKHLGSDYVSAGRWEEALEQYTKALSVYVYFLLDGEERPLVNDADPEDGDKPQVATTAGRLVTALVLNIALCMIKLERWQEGIQACDRVHERDPGCAKALYRRALCRFGAGGSEGDPLQVDRGIADLERALAISPASAEIAAALAKARGERKRRDKEARQALRGLFRAAPADQAPAATAVPPADRAPAAAAPAPAAAAPTPAAGSAVAALPAAAAGALARRRVRVETPATAERRKAAGGAPAAALPVEQPAASGEGDPAEDAGQPEQPSEAPGLRAGDFVGDRLAAFSDAYRECMMDGATNKHGVWFDRSGRPLI